MNMNHVSVGGNLTRDPELRYTPKGTAVTDFGVANNRNWYDEAGDLQEEVNYFDCVAFGKPAETISQYFGKGGAICVEGRLKQESWEDKQTGKPRYKIKIIVEKFHFCGDGKGKGKDGGGSEPAPRRGQPAPAGVAASSKAPPPDDEDDVPF